MIALIAGCALGALIALIMPQSILNIDMGYVAILLLASLNAVIRAVEKKAEAVFPLKAFLIELLIDVAFGSLLIFISRTAVDMLEAIAYAALSMKLVTAVERLRKGKAENDRQR